MCASTDLLTRYATLRGLPVTGQRWLPKVLADAARAFYCPGNSQPSQFTIASKAFLEAKTAIQKQLDPPKWLQTAVSCEERAS